jgi:hypothetical protein
MWINAVQLLRATSSTAVLVYCGTVAAQEAGFQRTQETSEERIEELERAIDQVESKQGRSESKIRRLEYTVRRLESEVRQEVANRGDEAAGVVLFLFGVFCALWAQNTDRNPWLWFFMGLLFNIITVLVLLAKNADDKRTARRAASRSP